MDMLAEQIASHMEYLGFRVEKRDSQKEGVPPYFVAKSEDHGTFRIVPQAPYFVLMTVGILFKREPSPEMAEYMNELNSRLLVCRAWYEKADKGVVILFEAPYMGLYKKDQFLEFYNLIRNDRRAMHKDPACARIFNGGNSQRTDAT